MKRPNFFIVGAPKCGTTALFQYLSEHPAVFAPKYKEPHFFASDLHATIWHKDERHYLDLFEPARPEHLAAGEASVFYLYSSEAIPRIREFNPDARLIVMVRDPVEMFRSFHQQQVASFWEDEPDPERAWRLQEERLAGSRLPALCEDVKLLLYRPICLLGEQVTRLLDVFPREQVQIILFEDFIVDPGAVYRETLGFLGVPNDGRTNFPPVNVAHASRWQTFGRLYEHAERAVAGWRHVRAVRSTLLLLRPVEWAFRQVRYRRVEKTAIREAFRRELQDEFAPDIARLSEVTGRDLAYWIK